MAQTLYPLGGAAVATTTVNLTSANILNMSGTPVQILPAPPAGQVYIIQDILFEMTTTSTQYANGGAVSFVYHGTTVPVHAGVIPASVVTAGAGTSNTWLGGAVAPNGTTVTSAGVDITNITAPFITGTGTAKVQITYITLTL